MALEFLDGNEAVARAAMRAGCGFFAGYPITPASSILHYMLDLLPPSGGVAIQAEDEIASIGMTIGAAMAGKRAMTATSGPGISLYSENIGLAVIGETPLVIVNVQRQGPATGSATKGADGDIQFTRWVTSGGLPVIALCPASVGDAYELTYRAFNLADKYRTPVFVLSNKEIGMTQESVDLDAIELPPAAGRKRPSGNGAYRPHDFEAVEEVPPLADFGDGIITQYTTSTHDKDGYLTADPEVIQEMIDHYAAKIDAIADELALYRHDPQAGADTLVISYGVTSRSARVAVREARQGGRKVSALTLQTLYPVPEKVIRDAARGVERLAPAGAEIVAINKMDTTLISPGEILDRGGLR